jgi:hypothetical protein
MNKRNLRIWLTLAPVFLVICMLAGCAAKEAPVYGDPQTGVILQYRMPEGQVLKYESWGKTHQVSDVMGQTIEADISSSTVFTVKSDGQQDNDHRLTITIDNMGLKIQSTQGELEPEGTRNISTGFQDIFPNFADNPVKIGDTWPDESTITEKTSSGEAVIHFSGVNTLAGFETIEGMECVKVTAEGTGTIEGTGEQQGIELVTTGEIKGTVTWYFAYKEGIFIKQVNEGTVEGTVDVPSQGVQIPFTRESTSEIKLIK